MILLNYFKSKFGETIGRGKNGINNFSVYCLPKNEKIIMTGGTCLYSGYLLFTCTAIVTLLILLFLLLEISYYYYYYEGLLNAQCTLHTQTRCTRRRTDGQKTMAVTNNNKDERRVIVLY